MLTLLGSTPRRGQGATPKRINGWGQLVPGSTAEDAQAGSATNTTQAFGTPATRTLSAHGSPFLELPASLRRFSHEEILAGTDSMSPARVLGKGGFGPVFLMHGDAAGAMQPGGGSQPLAAKVGTNVGEESVGQGRNEFENEVLLLWLWQHPRIVRLEGVSTGPVPCLVYEHMAGGSLAGLLADKQRAAAFSAAQRLTVATDVAHALAYLHEGGCGAQPTDNPRVRHAVVLHRDVNTSNVLLDGALRGKLGDFGLCAMVHQADVHAGMVFSGNQLMGQWAWTAPEAQELGNMPASDIYALGLVMLQLLSGCDDSDLPVVRASACESSSAASAGSPAALPLETSLSADRAWPAAAAELVFDVAVRCTDPSPAARPCASEACAALLSILPLLSVAYQVPVPVLDTGGVAERFEPCRIDRTGHVRTMLHFTPPREAARGGRTEGRWRTAGGGGEALRMYKWEGPGGRGASEDKRRAAAVSSVVAVVCCDAEQATRMLDYCAWDVTAAVERFLAGHPVPPQRPDRHPPAPLPSRRQQSTHAGGAHGRAGEGEGGAGVVAGSARAAAGGSGAGGGGFEAGVVRLPEGAGTGSGRVVFGDGSSFTGAWVDGVVEGHGVFEAGDKEYTGEFRGGRMHGRGLHRWLTEEGTLEYDGAWCQGRMQGSGVVTKNGTRYQCVFDRGALISQQTAVLGGDGPVRAERVGEGKNEFGAEERAYMIEIFRSVLLESSEAEAAECLAEHAWDLQVRGTCHI